MRSASNWARLLQIFFGVDLTAETVVVPFGAQLRNLRRASFEVPRDGLGGPGGTLGAEGLSCIGAVFHTIA